MASALLEKLPELAEKMALRIRSEVGAYQDEALIPLDSLRVSCFSNAHSS
ncbi:hypothetical protein [Streptomyces sp. WAC04657]|nr:hypothetical protein [Streptomyces sp. WAC04657]